MSFSSQRLLDGVRDIGPQVAARAAEMERARRMPRDLVEQLRAIGLFRMLVPRGYGGCGIDTPAAVNILAELARADGASAWVVMIGCHAPLIFSMFPRSTFDKIYAHGPDIICAGSSAPRGKAERTEGGYQVGGHWSLASGCQHADWMFGVCTSVEEKPAPDGAPPPVRFITLPADRWRVVDAWNAAGLRGTGSHDIVLDNAHVDESGTVRIDEGAAAQKSFGEAGLVATHLQMIMHVAAVAIGIAEGALDDVTEVARSGKRRLYTKQLQADMPVFQHRLGRAEAGVHAARAYLNDRAARYWQQALGGHVELSRDIDTLQTATWVVETCIEAVDSCFRAAGASAVYDSSPIQRRLRDIHALAQHILVDEGFFTGAGAARVGRPPEVPFVRPASS